MIGQGVALKASVESVAAEGTDKVVFKLKNTDYRFHYSFIAQGGGGGFIVLPKHIWEGQNPTEFRNPNAVFSGPYKLKSTNPETRVVIWERRDDYWNKEKMPAPKYMVWTQAPRQDLSTFEWEQGNYDLGSLESAPVKAAMQKNPNIAQYQGLDPCPRRIAFNHTVKPLDDPAFRHALSLLVDRQKTVNTGDPPGYPNVVPWPYDPTKGPPPPVFYDSADIDKYDIGKYDPAKAAQILDEAGYKVVDGKRVDKDGKPIQLRAITFQPQYTEWRAWADIMQKEAEKLGIQIDVEEQEVGTFVANLPNGQYDISFFWDCPRPDDPIAMYINLLPENFKEIGTATWANPYRYKPSQEFIDTVEQMRVGNPADPAIQALYKKAFGLLYADYPYGHLFGDYFVIPYNNEYWVGYEKANILVYWGTLFRHILTFIEPAK
jgi:peptide/nickel transport system substrate-binding protein